MAGFSILILSFYVLLSACSFFHKDPVVLQIHEQKWTATLFAERLAQKINSFNREHVSDHSFMARLKKQLIGDLLMEYLIQKRAKEYSLIISEKEWQKALQKIQQSYTSQEVFDLYLRREKKNKKHYQQGLKRKLLHEKVLHHIGKAVKKPSEKESRDYYQNHLNLFKKKDSLLIHHVFHQKKEKALGAREVLKREVRERDKKSLKSDVSVGEKLWVEQGSFALFDRAFSLKKGEISPVWPSPYAYHVIQVLEKKPARLIPYKEALPRVQKLLMDQRRKALFTEWLSVESQKAVVWTDNTAIEKIKVEVR